MNVPTGISVRSPCNTGEKTGPVTRFARPGLPTTREIRLSATASPTGHPTFGFPSTEFQIKVITLLILASLLPAQAWAQTTPLALTIASNGIDVKRTLALSDPGESHDSASIAFGSQSGQTYSLIIKHKDLPDSRSYPGNLDITLKDAEGKSSATCFYANNGIAALRRIGIFGFIVAVKEKPIDVKLRFSDKKPGTLHVAEMGNERLISDTLVPKFGFQMIRPMLLPQTAHGVRSQTYNLPGCAPLCDEPHPAGSGQRPGTVPVQPAWPR